jgi:integrase
VDIITRRAVNNPSARSTASLSSSPSSVFASRRRGLGLVVNLRLEQINRVRHRQPPRHDTVDQRLDLMRGDTHTTTLLAAVGDCLGRRLHTAEVMATLAATQHTREQMTAHGFTAPGARPGASSTACAARQVDSSANGVQVPLPTISPLWSRKPALRGCHLNDRVFRDYLAPALKAIGREDMRIHDLRHFAGTQAARVGNLPETMQRLGHSTAKASLLYQSIASGRAEEVAEALSRLAKRGTVEPDS